MADPLPPVVAAADPFGSFVGKTALITGSTHGAGREVALAFARSGANVVANGLDAALGASVEADLRTAGGSGAIFVQADIRDEAAVAAMIDRAVATFGRLDCAFNNAGAESVGLLVEQTAANCDLLNETNIRGTFLCLKHELRVMQAAGGGAIVNHASVTSSVVGTAKNGLYAATKAAIIGLTRSAALEAGPHNVSVNAIASLGIDVPGDMFWRWIADQRVSPEQIKAAIPMGRLCAPEELAAAVLFLCSDRARFITGHTLVVDGGFTAQ